MVKMGSLGQGLRRPHDPWEMERASCAIQSRFILQERDRMCDRDSYVSM